MLKIIKIKLWPRTQSKRSSPINLTLKTMMIKRVLSLTLIKRNSIIVK